GGRPTRRALPLTRPARLDRSTRRSSGATFGPSPPVEAYMHRLRLLPFAALLLSPGSLAAQQRKPAPPPATPPVPEQPPELKGLKYRLVGPHQGGRVSRVAGIPGDPTTYYLASASGGVWKSTDGGIN